MGKWRNQISYYGNTRNLSKLQLQLIYSKLCNYFSSNELRGYESQFRAFLHPNYYISYLLPSRISDAFVLWWNFGKTIFVEYIVIIKEKQLKGLGSILIKNVCARGSTIILEVKEKSENNLFFEKNGFVQNPYKYEAIPLKDIDVPEKYLIYSYGKVLTSDEYFIFNKEISKPEYQF